MGITTLSQVLCHSGTPKSTWVQGPAPSLPGTVTADWQDRKLNAKSSTWALNETSLISARSCHLVKDRTLAAPQETMKLTNRERLKQRQKHSLE